MKNAKRVLVGVLAVAMLVCGLLVYSFATETADDPAADIPDYADILKYYDPLYSKLYDNEDFEDGEYSGNVVIMNSALPYTTASVSEASGNKYLALTLGHILIPDARTDAVYNVEFGGSTLSKVIMRASVSASHTESSGKVCNTCSYTTLNMSESLCPRCGIALETVASTAPAVVIALAEKGGVGDRLLTFDFNSGRVSYSDGAASDVYIDGLTITEESWYDVELVFDSTQYKFKITDGSTVYEASGVNAPFYTAKAVSIGARYIDDCRNATVMVDNVFVQAGVDDRNIGVDLVEKTNAGLELIRAMLVDDTYSPEIRRDVIAVYDTLLAEYGDRLASDETTEALHLAIKAAVLDFFRAQLKKATDAIDIDSGYPARLALIEDNAVYADRVRALLLEVYEEDSAATLALYDNEKAELESIKVSSEDFISYINDKIATDATVFTSDDYSVLKVFVEQTEARYLDEEGNTTYDSTYPPIKDSVATYNMVSNKYKTALAKSVLFCEYVATAKPAEEDLLRPEADRVLTVEQFRACLAAYDAAGDLAFSNVTYPGMTEALEVYSSLVNLSGIAVVAERFINNVATAEQAIYIFMKEEWLNSAEQDYNVADERYAGVTEAKALYNALRAEIEAKKVAAEAYIAAVKNLEGKSGDELIAAIDAAMALRDAGNVLGYEGIADANIALDNAYKSRQLDLAYAAKFIKLVAAIKDAQTLEERFTAISLASNAGGYALDTIDGVAAARQELVTAISLYNSDIAAINSSYSSAASNAGDIASAGTCLSGIIKLVASVIQSIAG